MLFESDTNLALSLCASDPGREGLSDNGNTAIDLSAPVELIISGKIPVLYKNRYSMAYSVIVIGK